MKNKASSTNIYFYLSLFCFILLFVNYYRTDSWTGDKPFSEFAQHDWHLLTIFLIEEIVIVCVMLFFCFLTLKKQF